MFVYVRYIAILCIGIGSIVTVLLSTIFANKAENEVYQTGFGRHSIIAQTIAVGLWRPYAPISPKIINTTVGPIQVPIDAKKFPAEAENFLKQFTEERVTLYALRGTESFRLASNYRGSWTLANGSPLQPGNNARIATGQSTNQMVEAIAANGKRSLLLQSIVSIPKADMNGERVMGCIKSYHPSCKPEVFVEIVTDMTTQLSRIMTYRWLFTLSSVGLFVLVGGILLVTVSRAETIIAKQHEVNLELTATAAAAEAQSRDKSMFLASISHELRTPLNAIIGFSEIIKTEGRATLQREHQDYIDDIHASGKHLLALINDILDFSKAEAGKLQLEYSEVDMLKLIRNSMRMVMPRAEESQVTLVENLPKESIVITTDVKKLKQVLLNLFSNAVKFTPAGGDVRVSAWEDIVTKDIVLEVKDSGIGIAPKDISRVMMPFVQVDSTLSRKFEGTGLGLPLSKKFVESMGGQFFIESEVNKGTTITVRLPERPASMSGQTEAMAAEEPDVEAS